MKRVLTSAALFALVACATQSQNQTPPATGKREVSGFISDKINDFETARREKALQGYLGIPGNFSYHYGGGALELIDVVGVSAYIAPSKEMEFLHKLSTERMDLLMYNLFDTGVDADQTTNCASVMAVPHRTATGNCYFYGYDKLPNLTFEAQRDSSRFANQPRVGDNHQRFGRNVSPAVSNAEESNDIMEPNPRLISQKLFTRKTHLGIPQTREADIINVLAAAWLQAENHDWFTHGKNVNHDPNPHVVPPVAGDTVFPHGVTIPRTQPDADPSTASNGYSKTFRNHVTHWWDASHIYGSDEATIVRVRTNPETGAPYDADPGTLGFIAVDMKNRHLYYDSENLPITGFNDNWWLGLDMIHSLFAMEHNDIAKQLQINNPTWSAEQIFQTARMINAALIAKIHTVEWTPALLDNKVLHVGMYSNWFGIGKSLGVHNAFLEKILANVNPRLAHAVSGLTGVNTLNLYEVPFTLTEEFVAVYRMHPLLPEFVARKDLQNTTLAREPVSNLAFRKVPGLFPAQSSALEWMYGFGTGHPGGLVLHNYPSFLQHVHAERNTGVSSDEGNASDLDMGAVDVLRDRERNVPRYNAFRKALRLKELTTFDDLTDDKEDVKLLNEIYKGDVNKLDLIVGTLAEKDRFAGFAFGNTPFYIFALMASRRLMADPFYSDYFTAQYYTQFGIDWVNKQTMINVIARHYPELISKFGGAQCIPTWKKGKLQPIPRTGCVRNAFRPWQPEYDVVAKKYSK